MLKNKCTNIEIKQLSYFINLMTVLKEELSGDRGTEAQLVVHLGSGKAGSSLLDQETPTPPSWHRAEVARRVAEADAHPEASISLEQLKRELRPDQA